ncbi:Lsr2 family protein [Streptomyces sp. NBC_00510]
MAQRVQTLLVDDIDGGTAHETVNFGLDGREYEIDLSDDNAAALRDALAPFQKAARKQSRSRGRGVPQQRTQVGADNAAVRAWAKSNGVEISDRGRISESVRRQFEAASNG